MSILKCKMCGGDLNIQDDMTVAECEYCGTTQTLPKLVSDDIANLYDRANHFRRNNEFDKAEGIYERILSQTPEDSEAYWSLVLCRYGIEYVEDPETRKRVPTVNRTQYTSVFDDENYKSAIAHADAIQRRVYEEEAAAINEIQKGILAISQKEEPFDVFICYKETDRNGRRTPDSVLATDLYHQLTNEGFKVFFARITLEDKLGSAYEPYIFAALNSAKVMVVLGTKPEYFNAVWVKNEWSRYLALVNKSGGKKVLIPAYRDMDPYDLPEEFSHLQAQDMSKLGFMQDLIRGIKKITGSDKPKAQPQVVSAVTGASDVAPLLKRMFMYLEDGEWDKANEYSERVLDKNPESAEAYVGKLMADIRVRRREALKDQAQPFDNNKNYQKAVRFADAAFKNELTGCIRYINDRNAETKRKQEEERRRLEKERREEEQRREEERRKNAYDEAISIMNNASTEDDYKRAENSFYSASGYKDADALAKKCNESAETYRKDSILCKAKEKIQNDTLESYKLARDDLKSISGWKDADDRLAVCETKISELTAKKEEEDRIAAKKKKKRIIKFASIIVAVIIFTVGFVIVLNTVVIPNIKYNTALDLFNAEKNDEAIAAFTELDGYRDSTSYIQRANTRKKNAKQYSDAVSLMKTENAESLEQAKKIFIELSDYKDSKQLAEKCNDMFNKIAFKSYNRALEFIDKKQYVQAYDLLSKHAAYSNASEKMQECLKNIFSESVDLYNKKEYSNAFSLFKYCKEKNYNAAESTEYMKKCNDLCKSQWIDIHENYPLKSQYTDESQHNWITVNKIRYRYVEKKIEFSVDYSIIKNEFANAYYLFICDGSQTTSFFDFSEIISVEESNFVFSVDYEKLMLGFRNGEYNKVYLNVYSQYENLNGNHPLYDYVHCEFLQKDLEKRDLYGNAF